MASIIKVDNLEKTFKDGKVKAVKGVSFSVDEGEIFSLLGPNGAGKTTTVEMIEGLISMDKGSVVINGMDIKKHENDIKRIIGVTLQANNFFDDLSINDILKLFGHLFGIEVNTQEFLEKVSLQEKGKVLYKDISGGQKQRFVIALALINNPKILFLDEPTNGLDPQARRHLWDIVKSLKEEGKTILLTTHFMDEAQYLSDRVAIMDNGKIIVNDTPSNLIQSLLDRGFNKEVIEERANLEDVFIDLTGNQLRD
jgi:ABC-2 type transport system ATP-binding protein